MLFGAVETGVRTVATASVFPNPDQPRKKFSPEKITELADSILAHGQLSPIIVTPRNTPEGEPGYMIVAGERRWRALTQILRTGAPIEALVDVRYLSDSQIEEIAMIENVTREDMTPIEEANGYAKLLETRDEEEVSRKTGKSVAHIRRRVRLLTLHPDVQAFVDSGQLSVSHAEVIARIQKPSHQLKALHRWQKDGLTVQAVAALAESYNAVAAKDQTIALFDLAATKPTAAQRRAQNKLDKALDETAKLVKACTDPKTLELIPTLRGLSGRDLEKVRTIMKELRKLEAALAVGQGIKKVRKSR